MSVRLGLDTGGTFTDIVAYTVAIPVLPDIGRRFGASPTIIGLLFASFGVTLLGVSMPIGAVSDRTAAFLWRRAGLSPRPLSG